MSNIKELAVLPDLSFIDNRTLQDVKNEMVTDYLQFLSDAGEEATLGEAHPDRLIMYSAAAQIYQALQYIDRGAKMNFLKYSKGEYLDNLAAFKKLDRLQAQSATTVLKFTLSAMQGQVVGIPGGTRAKTDGNVYFVTDQYVEVPAGEMTAEVTATAYNAGTASNNVDIGEVKTIVDPVGYVASVTNITASKGGADIESDDELTLRIYEAPPSLSVAGPAPAYVYWAKRSRADIEDVIAYSPDGHQVNVVFMLNGGALPDEADISQMETFLQDKQIRPLTDAVTAIAPTEEEYSINLTYYISKSDEDKAQLIQSAVNEALTEYQNWQRKIGRDINPSKLYQYLMEAGAKRLAITAPIFVDITDYAIPKVTSVTCSYGGVEND